MATPYTEALEAALGRIVRDAARDLELYRVKADALVAELRAANDALSAELRQSVADRLAVIRDGKDGLDGKDGAQGPQGECGADGKDGAPGSDGLPGKDGIDGKDGAQGLQGERGADGKDGAPGSDGLPGKDGIDGKDGAQGPQGERGADGLLPSVEEWQDRVHYAGQCVVRDGATWQAANDTGHAPPHADWRCIAAAGQDGHSFTYRGTWVADGRYSERDVVMLNGSTFAARCDVPGVCPGDDWHLWASRGSRGMAGERGVAGERGAPGKEGSPGAAPVALTADDSGLITLVLADGTELQADLYPVFSRVAK